MVTTEHQARARWVPALRIGLGFAIPLALLALTITRWRTVDSGTDAVSHADPGWLVIGLVGATLTWVAAACGQLGATTVPLPPARMLATQVAGSCVNHVLPAGFGGAAVTLRMMRRCGMTNLRATQAIGLNLAAGVVVHLTALAAVLAIFGFGTAGVSPRAAGLVAAAVAALGVLGALLWRWSSTHERRLARRVRELVTDSQAALGDRRRAAMLWTGSAALPALHILILDAVVHALDQSLSLLTITVVYLAASAVSALVPSPGGFGSLDVALLGALTGAGAGAVSATAIVVGYRLLTVWIPMIPSAATLLVLLRLRFL